jgi:hypothetical protein
MANVLDPLHTAGQLDAGYQQKGLQPLAKSLEGQGQQVSDQTAVRRLNVQLLGKQFTDCLLSQHWQSRATGWEVLPRAGH